MTDIAIPEEYIDCPRVEIFVAITPKHGIGRSNGLPWPNIKRDLLFLMRGTTYVDPEVKKKHPDIQNVIIIGRKTYESFISSFPLKNRINVVISRQLKEVPGGHVFPSLPLALKTIKNEMTCNRIIILGGGCIYKEALSSGLCDKIYLTRVNKEYEADIFFPQIPDCFHITGISKTFGTDDTTFDFVVYEKKDSDATYTSDPTFDELLLTGNKLVRVEPEYKTCPSLKIRLSQELQYLDILADILNNGVLKSNRTGVECISKFGYQMRFDLSESFPLLTTKKVFLRGIIEELLWFIQGSTNGNDLLAKNVKIWELNGRREFLDNMGFTDREEHDLGPVYGFQWRHFGAEYVNAHKDYSGEGVDQLINVIKKIKENQNDRRLIVCSWNVADIPKMALPPCHLLFQFYVSDGRLSCMMHQRSCDMGLGVPFNISSYSLLTCMVAQVTGLKPGEFVHNLGDAHIYVNHVEHVKIQLSRIPYPFPLLKLNKDITNIEDFRSEHISVENYVSHPAIKMEMAA